MTTFEPGRCAWCCECTSVACPHTRKPCEMCEEKLGVDVDEDTAISASLERALAEISNDIAEDVRQAREEE